LEAGRNRQIPGRREKFVGLVDLVTRSSSIAIDTNIFILALDHPGTAGEKASAFLEHIKKINPKVFISVLAIEEFFIKVYKEGREKDTAKLFDFISMGGLASIVDMNREIVLLAAKIRASYTHVRAPDAIHLATALQSKAKIFITTDRKLPRKINRLNIKLLF